jgi:hypothetical protein
MFYQNSNDLVKHASAKSGHVQNSKETSRLLITETQPRHIKDADTPVNFDDNNSMSSPQHSSLSIGAQFQNMIQGLFSMPIKEGLEGAGGGGGGGGGGVAPANPSSGGISGTNQVAYVNNLAAQHNQYTRETIDHDTKVGNIISLTENSNQNQRNIWVEVTDSTGITKYGYITRNGVFQIWHVPTSPSSNPPNWLETSTVKQNMGVIGCPAQSGSIQKIKIAGTWEKIKPYESIYDVDDTAKSKPFIIINDAVRDPKNSVQGKGLFSCGNEGGNVYVTERPSADFYLNDPDITMGCYVLADKVTDDDLTDRGFTFQPDLHEASISQCKRRAEDLGSSYFMISALNKNRPNNKGGCWVYTSRDKLNIKGLLEFDESSQKCHAIGNPEPDEDGYLNAYPTSKLKRLYGKEATVEVLINPPNPTCNHRNNDKCIFTDYKREGNTCYSPDPRRNWAYGVSGLASYDNNELKGWLNALHNRNGDNIERAAVNEYVERCKKTEGYEFLDNNPQKSYKEQRSVSLYSLKKGGPNGVDTTDRNGRGMVGRIAYIDYNGEKHDYPESALSYMKPSKNAAGETLPATYLNLGAYDTRSAESSYSLKGLSTPGKPIGESVVASFDKCRGLCDADEKCGGFVYTKGSVGADGKCELKDRTKMYPIGLRVADPTKQLMLKVPTINETISDKACKADKGAYNMINSVHYQYYPDTGAMTSSSKCDIRELIPKDGTTAKVDLKPMYGALSDVFEETESKIAEYSAQTAIAPPPPKATTGAEGFGVLREGMDRYADTMNGVAKDLNDIANAEYQRERLLAITEETNKLLMAESYKFILWSVLAILAVLAVLKLKEMFGQDDADDDDDGGGGGGGGLLATILGWFGVGTVKTDDIPDRTEDIKAALSSAGEQLKEAGTNLTTGITEGADNLVNSANDAAAGAIEGANNLVDKAKEVASGAIDKIGAAASSATTTTTTSVQPPSMPQPTTGGKKHSAKKWTR